MFEDLKLNIESVLSDNGISVYDEFSNIDLVKNFNRNIGFVSVKSVEKINNYQNASEVKSSEVFVTFECKIIAKKGLSASMFADTVNTIYTDFMFSEEIMPLSLSMGGLKVNSLYSRFEANITLKFRCFLTETVPDN